MIIIHINIFLSINDLITSSFIDVAIILINIIIFMDYLVATGRVFGHKLIWEHHVSKCSPGFSHEVDERSLYFLGLSREIECQSQCCV